MIPAFSPKISIITVCYNAADKIANTIKSVLTQSYPFIEYIIVDGASADNTQSVVESFGDKVSVVISEPDRGIYDAMNKGIKNASGDFVIFLNAGDYYISEKVLEFSVAKMNLKQADVFFGRFIWESPLTKDVVISDHSSVLYDWDLKKSNFPHPATFYKRAVFEKVGSFDVNFSILADYEWNARALVKHRIKFQYLNMITALFTTDGISNDAKNCSQINEEKIKIEMLYFQPSWVFYYIEKYLGGKSHLIKLQKKVIAKLFSKKLNRQY